MSQLHLTLTAGLYTLVGNAQPERAELTVYITLVEGGGPPRATRATWERLRAVHELTLCPAYRVHSPAAGRAVFATAHTAIDALLGEHEPQLWSLVPLVA